MPALPVTWRPLGPRVAGVVGALALVVVSAATWLGFDEQTKATFTLFQLLTLAAFALLVGTVLHALLRSRVVAARGGLTVVNGYRRRELAWAQVVSVNLPPGAPWVTLDLSDGSTVPAMGIQSSDGARARLAVRQLRVLVAELPR